jgi:hypothetical protein
MAGLLPPITTDSSDEFVGRFIQLNLKIDSFNTRGVRIKGKSILLALI